MMYSQRLILMGGHIPVNLLKGKYKQVNIADYDNDGLPDIMVYNPKNFLENMEGPGLSQSKIAWFSNTGIYNPNKYQTHNGRPIAGFKGYYGSYLMTASDSSSIIPIDLNDDNHVDLLRISANGQNLLHQQLGNSFSPADGHFNFPTGVANPILPAASNLPLSFADFNADGLTDLYYRHPNYNGPVGIAFLNKGNLAFEQLDYNPSFVTSLNDYRPSSQIELIDLSLIHI